MNNLEFALEMKNKRLASGLSQGELASLTHVSRYSINRFENGKANASKETQNIILRCLNYYVCDKPFYLLVDYLSVRFPTTDALEVIRKVLGMKADYFIHYDYGYYGYKEHYATGKSRSWLLMMNTMVYFRIKRGRLTQHGICLTGTEQGLVFIFKPLS